MDATVGIYNERAPSQFPRKTKNANIHEVMTTTKKEKIRDRPNSKELNEEEIIMLLWSRIFSSSCLPCRFGFHLSGQHDHRDQTADDSRGSVM